MAGPTNSRMLSAILFLVFALAGCNASSLATVNPGPPPPPPPPPVPTSDVWTWVAGDTNVYAFANFGTQGTPSASNTPGARTYSVTWTDLQGNLWLFGGYGEIASGQGGDLNDLWEFSAGQWTWVGGANTTEQTGVYGTLGTAAPGNVPGARYQAVGWTDTSGNFWLFGGLGIDSTGTRGHLNDLWEYSSGQWTWMGGSSAVADSVPGVYGIEGTSAPDNQPGARVDAASWSDTSGNLWLFGGFGYDSSGTLGILNDLWRYASGQWTWMSGSSTVNAFGVYGVKTHAASGNGPGARTNPSTWTDADGNLWLFGGEGNDRNGQQCLFHGGGTPCLLNDLWKYNGGEWTWMGGSNVIAAPGVYGTQGTASASNFPGARYGAVSWADAQGNLWLFGGFGFDFHAVPIVYGDMNDLWKYSNGQWTWVNGPDYAGGAAAYGTKGIAALSNIPGARDSGVGWIDASGNLWLFSGTDLYSVPNGGTFNDLWEYKP